MNTSIGKVGRLPRPVRDELNHRLREGEKGRKLVNWLNSLPEVQAVLKAEFNGKAVSEANLTAWKQGGYRVWLARMECLEQARELDADAGELATTAGPVADNFARMLVARYAAVFTQWSGDPSKINQRELTTLHTLCEDVTQLRRGEHSAARLQLEREAQAWRNRSAEDEALNIFLRWAREPVVKRLLAQPGKSLKEKTRMMRELFGLAPLPPDEMTEGEPSPPKEPEPDPAQAKEELEKASQQLFRSNPPGLPALERLDEKFQEEKAKTLVGGLSAETILMIQEQAHLI